MSVRVGEWRAAVYRSIRSASPCLCVFREHRLCFPSIYSSLWFSHPPPFSPQSNHVTLWTQWVTSSSLLSCRVEPEWDALWITNTRPSPLPGFLVFMLSRKAKHVHSLVLCCVIMLFALIQCIFFCFCPAGKISFLEIKLNVVLPHNVKSRLNI